MLIDDFDNGLVARCNFASLNSDLPRAGGTATSPFLLPSVEPMALRSGFQHCV